jgi:molybdopterin synthase sulfur carrier subunit
MMIKVRLFATFRDLAGINEIDMDIGEGSVWDLLDRLCGSYPELKRGIFSGEALSDHVIILKNGRNIVFLDGLKTTISDGDELAIFPPVGGG